MTKTHESANLESQFQEGDSDTAELNLSDVELLRAVIVKGVMPSEGRTPLQCYELSTLPKQGEIVDTFSPVLGDLFQAMNRVNVHVPVKLSPRGIIS